MGASINRAVANDRRQHMRVDEDDGGEELFARDREYRAWVLLFLILAAGLWAQMLGAGAWAEMQSEDGSAAVLAAQLLPLLMGGLAVSAHQRWLRLFVFPVSFLPGMVLMTEAERTVGSEPVALLVKGVLFGLYLVVAAGRPATKDVVATPRRVIDEAPWFGGDRGFRRFVRARICGAVLVFAVISFALFMDRELVAAMGAVDSLDDRASHHAFSAVLVYFGWAITLYMGTILPILNWEYDRHQGPMPASLERLLRRPGRLRFRIMLWLAALIVVIVAAVMVFSR